MNFAKHAGNFDSVEEQQAFASDTASFLKTITFYHLILSLFLRKVLFDVNFLDAILKWNVFRTIVASDYPLVIKGMMSIVTGIAALGGILKFFMLFIDVHYRCLVIDLLLSLIGLGKRMMMLLMFVLNFFGLVLFGISLLFLMGLPWRW